jgi:hypothetical protein
MIRANKRCLLVDCSGHSTSFNVIRLSTCAKSDRKNLTPTSHQKQNGFFIFVFSGTFTCSKSRLQPMPGNQEWYWPTGPGNQAPGRPVSMLTRSASHGRHSTKCRSTWIGQRAEEQDTVWRVDRVAYDNSWPVSHMALRRRLESEGGTSRWRSTFSPEVLCGSAPGSSLLAAVGDRL